MNERIKELTERAEILFYQARINGYEYQGAEVTVEDLEKFAELIVRECALVLEQQAAFSKNGREAYLYGASLIEEHFGITE